MGAVSTPHRTRNNVRGSSVDKRVSEHKMILETEIDKGGVWWGWGEEEGSEGEKEKHLLTGVTTGVDAKQTHSG